MPRVLRPLDKCVFINIYTAFELAIQTWQKVVGSQEHDSFAVCSFQQVCVKAMERGSVKRVRARRTTWARTVTAVLTVTVVKVMYFIERRQLYQQQSSSS